MTQQPPFPPPPQHGHPPQGVAPPQAAGQPQYPPPPQQAAGQPQYPPPPQQVAPQQAAGEMTLEQYVYGELAPQLGQGEEIFEYGIFLRYNRKRNGGIDAVYIGAVTAYRIMLIETRSRLTKFDGFVPVPKFENHGLVVHNLNEIVAAKHIGVPKLGVYGLKPLALKFRDETKALYYLPPKSKVCASQESLATYPWRLEYIMSTPPPWPQGKLPPVPPDVVAANTKPPTDYGKRMKTGGMVAGGGLVLMIAGAAATSVGLILVAAIPLCIGAGLASNAFSAKYIKKKG